MTRILLFAQCQIGHGEQAQRSQPVSVARQHQHQLSPRKVGEKEEDEKDFVCHVFKFVSKKPKDLALAILIKQRRKKT